MKEELDLLALYHKVTDNTSVTAWCSPDKQILLVNADCLTVLPTLGKVDAVITDPPFNAGKNFANDEMPLAAWRVFCNAFACSVAALRPVNTLIEVGKNDTDMAAAFNAVMKYRWCIALNYTNAMRQGAVGYSNFGLVLWYGGKCFTRYMDRIDCALENTIDDFSHPSPKQVGHYARLVEMFSPDAATILDPFMGSGTTGVACVKLGRKFIGIEIAPGYFEIAKKRIIKAQNDAPLFDKPRLRQTEIGREGKE